MAATITDMDLKEQGNDPLMANHSSVDQRRRLLERDVLLGGVSRCLTGADGGIRSPPCRVRPDVDAIERDFAIIKTWSCYLLIVGCLPRGGGGHPFSVVLAHLLVAIPSDYPVL
jgi:hypothetical protein